MNTLLADTTLTQMFLENPWPAVVALVGVSAVLRIIGKRQEQKRLVVAGWIALALGLGVFVLASAVNTDRETLIARTEAFVEATSPADRAALDAIFFDSVVLLGPEGDYWDDLDADFVVERLDRFKVDVLDARDIDAVADRPGYGVSVMRVSHDVMGQRVPATQWEIGWQRDNEARWQITSLKWVMFGLTPPSRSLYR